MIVMVLLMFSSVGALGVGFFVGYEWAFQGVLLMVSILVPLLVDWNELESNCPQSIRYIWTRFIKLARWVDSWILQGRRFAGREWDKSEFVWKQGAEAESRSMSLWNLPPTSVKEGRRLCLDEEYMTRDEWSASTTKHIVAINFCYVVLREDFVRQQANRRSEHAPSKPSKKKEKAKVRKTSEDLLVNDRARSLYKTSYSMDDFDGFEGFDVGEAFRMNRSMKEPLSPSAANLDRVLRRLGTDSLEPSSASSSAFATSSDGSVVSPDNQSGRRGGSDQSWVTTTDLAMDLDWIDVGAKIGIRLLNSANVQRAMASQDTAERIKAISETVESKFRMTRKASYIDANNAGSNVATENQESATITGGADKEPDAVLFPLSMPVHAMWTSAAAAAAKPGNFSVSSLSDVDDESSIESSIRPADPCVSGTGQPLLRPGWSTLSGNERLKSDPQQRHFMTQQREVLQERIVANNGGMPSNASKPDKSNLVNALNETLHVSNCRKSMNEKKVDPFPTNSNHLASHIIHRRPAVEPGVKVVVPMLPRQPGVRVVPPKGTQYQMATVVSSKRIYVPWKNACSSVGSRRYEPNCLSVTAKLNKSFLRDGEFAEISFRVLDEWSPNLYAPNL